MLLDLIKSQLSQGAVTEISNRLGIDPGVAGTAVNALLPSLLGGLANNAQSPDGAQGILAALDRDHNGSVMDDLGGFISQLSGGGSQDGSKIVNHILGDKSETLAQGVSQQTGIGMGQVMGLMSTLAPIVMGALGKQKNEQGLDVAGLAGMLMGQKQGMQEAGLGSLLSLLDSNKDGNIMDDAMGMLGNFFGKK